jgi:TolA-binding protein
MASCSACRIEQTLFIEIERSTARQPHDDLVDARIRAFVGRAVEERMRTGSGLGQRRGARKWAAFAFAATLLLTTIGAAAVMYREHRRATAERATNAAIAVTLPAPDAVPQGRAEPNQLGEEAQDQPEKAIDKTNDDAPGARTPQRTPRAAAKAERTKAIDGSAAELFARANLLRRRDEVNEAVVVYRELQRSFPGSAEELLSRVVLGRLLLDRLDDAAAALAQFESYLAGASRGSLREEALVGRAVALGRLGRATEERTAWNVLLDAFPRSTSAARARARVAAIAP